MGAGLKCERSVASSSPSDLSCGVAGLSWSSRSPKTRVPQLARKMSRCFSTGGVVRPKKHADLFIVDWPGGPITLERLESPVERHGVMAADVGGGVGVLCGFGL
ncbi:hypothetical protein MRX96_049220, partial [Rhipicephalus microplus]